MRTYLHDIYRAIATTVVGLRITLRYYFARPVTVQYPQAGPVLQARYRGIHYFEIERCIACDLCAKACPVDCIYIEKTAPRKIDKATGVAGGGEMRRFGIDYAKCMFCALCIEPCPTECIHMGDNHDLSAYDRGSMVVEFTELAKQGRQTPEPLWMQQPILPEWAARRRAQWQERAAPVAAHMREAASADTVVPQPRPDPS